MAFANLRSKLRRFRKKIRPYRRSFRRAAELYTINRRAEFPRAESGLAAVSIVKNEGAYLVEWFEFHRLVGFDHFVIYDNGSTDNTAAILQSYADEGIVTFFPWRNFSQTMDMQKAANAHAIANFEDTFRWMAFFDLDEFIFSPKFDTVPEALDQLGDQCCVSINMQNFGPGGHDAKPAGLVIENYFEKVVFPPTPEQRTFVNYKTILDPTRVTQAGTHNFVYRDKGEMTINERGVERKPGDAGENDFLVSDAFRLNHYATKSHEELEKKRQRGRTNLGGKPRSRAPIDKWLDLYALATCEDKAILKFAPEVGDRVRRRLDAGQSDESK